MDTQSRSSFDGVANLARYNWPLYSAAAGVSVFGVVLAALPQVSPLVHWLALVGVAGVVWFSLASLAAFHWMFDRSEFRRWTWIERALSRPPLRWVHISAGIDEVNVPLAKLFPEAEGKVLDVFNTDSMTEPAITRARAQALVAPAIVARPDTLLVEDAWSDGVFVVLAAHEIRDRDERERFFAELARILSPEGHLVLIEHPRNIAGALAFGPGVMHFLPVGEWARLAAMCGLDLVRDFHLTPFIRVFIYGLRSQAGLTASSQPELGLGQE